MTDSRPLVVGVGNELRGDDGVGPRIAARLAGRGLRAIVHAGDGAGIIDLFATATEVVLIDATRSGAAPGTIHRLDGRTPLPAEFFHYSTHAFGLAEAVETARALNLLPERLTVYGIEVGDFAAGATLTPAVADAAARVELAARYPSVSA